MIMESTSGMMMEQKNKFPKNQDDVAAFILDIDKAIFSEQQQAHIVQAIKDGANSLPNTIGQLAGTLIQQLGARRAQEQGVQMAGQLAIMGAARAVRDLSGIAAGIGLPQLDEKGLQEAANIAGAILKPDQQPQGGPQGAPPQGAPPQAAPPQGQPSALGPVGGM